MAKSPDQPHAPGKPKNMVKRDPAKHSKKDPAKPTRAKAARADSPPTEPALAELLNPGIGQAPQAGYAAKLGPIDPDLAKALGIDDDTPLPTPPPTQVGPARLAQDDAELGQARVPGGREPTEPAARDSGLTTFRGVTGASATVNALEKLLREGRPEFTEHPWTPHRPPRPEKSEGGQRLVITSEFDPKGDQPQAIADLVEGVRRRDRTQVLLGVTGSGKTFTMAKVIEETQRPALVLAPNKTLAAQLYGEFRSFFPDNAVEYFVSYYDYYQPEAYIPRTDTYIEKDSSINEHIDRMRHAATR